MSPSFVKQRKGVYKIRNGDDLHQQRPSVQLMSGSSSEDVRVL